ncbi:hypothetical protein M9979_09825 [Sphingomonas sp. RP10(2022)]|uniref:Uncharacterized protein n=1 Tax=Sphingomonas liriopis TaxID=2949094 RepID=A0A9X2HPU1_9SPHN|nr:hypothetical protein [Sphingomonas liriopis]MCP3735166.1 hypothetical protein [Sphingomonas liriopis]
MTTDLSDIAFVKRIAIGGAGGMVTTQDVEAAVAMLNRCLTEFPKGRVIAIEHTPCVQEDSHGSHVFRLISYHIGFPRRPSWLDE